MKRGGTEDDSKRLQKRRFMWIRRRKTTHIKQYFITISFHKFLEIEMKEKRSKEVEDDSKCMKINNIDNNFLYLN